jgi:hypothetical protein
MNEHKMGEFEKSEAHRTLEMLSQRVNDSPEKRRHGVMAVMRQLNQPHLVPARRVSTQLHREGVMVVPSP